MKSPDKLNLTPEEKGVALKILKLPTDKRKRLLHLEMQRRGLPVELDVTPEERSQMLADAKAKSAAPSEDNPSA